MLNQSEVNRAVQTLSNSPKEAQMNKFWENEVREDGQLVNVHIHPKEGMPIIEIGSQNSMDIEDAKSALRAAGDFHRFGIYDHKLTTENLHIFAKVGPIKGLFRKTNIGVISTSYAGSLPIPVPSDEEYPDGWAQINLRRGRFYLSHFNEEYAELRSRKHDFIEALVQGYGFKLRVLPFNYNKGDSGLGLADTIIATWEEEDDQKAWEMRIAGFNRKESRDYMYAPVKKALQEHGGTLPKEMKVNSLRGEVNGGIVLTTITGELVDVLEKEHCIVKVHDTRNGKFNVIWDGSTRSKLQLAQVADSQGWVVELP